VRAIVQCERAVPHHLEAAGHHGLGRCPLQRLALQRPPEEGPRRTGRKAKVDVLEATGSA
jgi:hypothetical protein